MPNFISLSYPTYLKSRYYSEGNGKITEIIKIAIRMKHEIMAINDIKRAIISFFDIMVLRNNSENKLYNDTIPCGSYKETLNIFQQLSKILCNYTNANNINVYPSFDRIEKELISYGESANIIIDTPQYSKIEQDFKTMDNGYIELAFIIENDNSFKYITNEEYKKYLEDKELKEDIKNKDVMFPPHMLPPILEKEDKGDKDNMFTPDIINDMKQWIKEIEDKKHLGNKDVMYAPNILSTVLDKFPPKGKHKCE